MTKQELCAHLLLLGVLDVHGSNNSQNTRVFMRYVSTRQDYNIQIIVSKSTRGVIIRYDLDNTTNTRWHTEMYEVGCQNAFDFVRDFLIKYPDGGQERVSD